MDGMQGKAVDLFSQLVTLENILIAVGIYVVLITLNKVVPELYHNVLFKRLLPLIPLLMGIAAKALYNITSHSVSKANIVMVGIICGYASSNLHKIIGQSIRGFDHDIAGTDEAFKDVPKKLV